MLSTLYPAEPVARALTLATTAASLSTGVFYAVSALYFTRVVGLTPTTVGLGLTIAGAFGVMASYAAGWVSDRVGADRILLGCLGGQGFALLAYVAVAGAGWFIVVASCAVAFRAAHGTARQAILARWFTGAVRVDARARIRVVNNVFIGLGTVLAGVVLVIDTAAAYRLAMAMTGLLLLIAMIPIIRLRRTVPELAAAVRASHSGDSPDSRGRSPLTDRTYLVTVALSSVLGIQFGLQTVGVPLWVAAHTDAPTVTISALMVVNTVFVALLQVPASRGTQDIAVAGRAVRRAGGLLALGCGLFAAAAYGGPVVAVVVLVLAALALAAGEVLFDAGNWGLAFELADPRSAGAYQGLSQTGYAVAAMMAPLVVTATAVSHGTAGWALLAAMFVAGGLATAVVARHASRRRALQPQPIPVSG